MQHDIGPPEAVLAQTVFNNSLPKEYNAKRRESLYLTQGYYVWYDEALVSQDCDMLNMHKCWKQPQDLVEQPQVPAGSGVFSKRSTHEKIYGASGGSGNTWQGWIHLLTIHQTSPEASKTYLEVVCIITKCKKPIWKGGLQYNSNYTTFWKGQNYGDSKISGCQGESGEMNRWRTEDCPIRKTILYDSIKVDTYHCPCDQTHRIFNTKSETM